MSNPTTFLTLNTEMHTASMNRVDSDATGKYILTCSTDKTAKLWDSSTGKLLQTYRPSIGKGNEGMLYAGAISPDGKTVAVGGWSKSRNHDIYIFNTSTGALFHRIIGLPNVIFDLHFSSNGRYLAAALGGGKGIRVYRSGNWRSIFQDEDYGDDSDNLAFASSGLLASVCSDGYIRLYASDFTLLQKVKTSGGRQPFSLAFSPDDRLLAVGYDDSPKIQVLEASSLKLLYEPDVKDANTLNNRLNKVVFSPNGKYLVAGGFYSQYKNGEWWKQIRVWEQAGKGSYQDYNACDRVLMDIKALPNGNLIYGGTSPDWGILQPEIGKQLIYKAKELNSYASKNRSHFKISRAAYEIGCTPFGQSALTFDVGERQLEKVASYMPAYKDQVGSLQVSNWEETYEPLLNDKKLSFLETYEMCHSVDIANDGQSLVFGASYGIYKLDAQGKKVWNAKTQATAWAVNIAGNGQVVATALANGQVRWYRMSDGELLLSLFLHPDQERWVLWTPSGYYDASPGAEDLIGWHVNQGADEEALFYPIDRFRDTYYRSDVIDFILEELDESKAVARANELSGRRVTRTAISEALPPTVRILSPAKGASVSSESITLEYSLQSANKEPITGVKILIDGRPVGDTRRGIKPSGTKERVTIKIPSKDCTVSVIAENKHGKSEEASVFLKWAGHSQRESDLFKPTLYILAIGVGNYQNLPQLDYAAKDARDLVAAFQSQEGLLYKKVVPRLLTDSEATKDNILDGLEWIQRETTSRDLAMLFFAGHGLDNNAATFYFMPQEGNLDALKRTGVMNEDIKQTIATIAGKVVVFMDACHSGSLMKSTRRNTPDLTRILNEFSSAENGAITFSSSTSRQYSLEDARWGNGAFTKALVEGIRGKAEYKDKDQITCKTLDVYIVERVKELTGGKQSPVTEYPPNTPDFPIAIIKD